MAFHETLANETALLGTCLHDLGIGTRQVVGTHTGLGRTSKTSESGIASLTAYLGKALNGLHPETVADFFLKNEQPHPIEPHLAPGHELVSVSETTLEDIFRDDKGWNRFRKTYPNSRGHLEFSRVGFNKLATQGLIYVGIQSDWLAGYGSYYLYNLKPKEGWVLSGNAMAWIS